MKSNISRRDFLKTSGVIAGSSLISSNLGASSIEDIPFESNKKITVALVGTGSRGIFMWGKDLVVVIPIILNSWDFAISMKDVLKLGKE